MHRQGRKDRYDKNDKNRHDYNTLPSLRGKNKKMFWLHIILTQGTKESVASLNNVCSRLYWADIHDDTEVSLFCSPGRDSGVGVGL